MRTDVETFLNLGFLACTSFTKKLAKHETFQH